MNIATIKVSGVKAVTNDYPTIPAGIVGVTVTFEFTDPAWDGLNKTAVFRGCVTRDVLMTGNVVRIPAETVAQACPFLFVGVYGTDAADNLVIPTLWLSLGTVRDAADPSGDPGTDPDLPVWAQLQNRVEALETGAPSDPDSPGTPGRPGEDGGYYTPAVTQPSSDTVEFAFSPSKPDMPAVDPVQVKLPAAPGSGGNADYVVQDTPPEDTSVLWVDPTDNTDDGFQEAVNTALAQAKASGEFDGADGQDGKDGVDGKDGYTPQKGVDYFDGKDGQPGKDGEPGADGKDYVLTDADKTEIAEMAAELVDVPGGGSGDSAAEWHHIRTVTIPEDASTDTSGVTFSERTGSGSTDYIFGFDTDKNGNSFALSELFVRFNCGTTHTVCSLDINYGAVMTTSNKNKFVSPVVGGNKGSLIYGWVYFMNLGSEGISLGIKNGGSATDNVKSNRDRIYTGKEKGFIKMMCFNMSNNLASYGFMPGSTFEIYGR